MGSVPNLQHIHLMEAVQTEQVFSHATFLTVLYYYAPLGAASNEALFRILPFWMCIFTTNKATLLIAVAYVIAPINAVVREHWRSYRMANYQN